MGNMHIQIATVVCICRRHQCLRRWGGAGRGGGEEEGGGVLWMLRL